ncbi:MAG TPA: histidine kinase [Thermoanaerobaculia bacterium]|nr:histidine kinase [Thermoanaerobaculia bacterium]
MSSVRSRERRLLAAGVLAFWTLLAVVALGNDVVREVVNDCSPTVGQALARLPDFARRQLPPFALWALLTPAVFALAARLPVTRASLWRRAPLHLAVAVVAAACAGAYKAAAHDLLVRHDPPSDHALAEWLRGGFAGSLPLDLPVYCAVLGVGFALAHYRAMRRREARAARLEGQATELRARLAEARFDALRHQLHPHFLFNTLNTVAALVERDPATTRATVVRLSELLRRALDGGDRQEVTLAEELSFVEGYLEIERTRFGDRFAVRLRVEDGVRGALVPSLILQPLVENAIRHGIARATRPGRIWIDAGREGGRLRLRVRDDGPGCGPRPPRAGVGLSNTAGRLEALHGAAASLELSSPAGGGFEASILLPLRYPEAGEARVESVAV